MEANGTAAAWSREIAVPFLEKSPRIRSTYRALSGLVAHAASNTPRHDAKAIGRLIARTESTGTACTVARRLSHIVELLGAVETLPAVALNRAKVEIDKASRPKRHNPLQRNSDNDALVEAPLAKPLSRNICQREPRSDLDTCIENPNRFERGTVVSRQVSAGMDAQGNIVPGRFVVETDVTRYGLVVLQIEQAVEAALLNAQILPTAGVARRQ